MHVYVFIRCRLVVVYMVVGIINFGIDLERLHIYTLSRTDTKTNM
jgi:hypothetical protein